MNTETELHTDISRMIRSSTKHSQNWQKIYTLLLHG